MSKQYMIRLGILTVVAVVVFSLLLGAFNPGLALLVALIVAGGGVLLHKGRTRAHTGAQ